MEPKRQARMKTGGGYYFKKVMTKPATALTPEIWEWKRLPILPARSRPVPVPGHGSYVGPHSPSGSSQPASLSHPTAGLPPISGSGYNPGPRPRHGNPILVPVIHRLSPSLLPLPIPAETPPIKVEIKEEYADESARYNLRKRTIVSYKEGPTRSRGGGQSSRIKVENEDDVEAPTVSIKIEKEDDVEAPTVSIKIEKEDDVEAPAVSIKIEKEDSSERDSDKYDPSDYDPTYWKNSLIII